MAAELDSLHSKYWYRKTVHEAGYDSMLTAILFIRLSAHLHTRGQLPRGYRGRLENIAFEMTNDPWPGVADLFSDNHSSSISRHSGAGNEHGGSHGNAPKEEPIRGLSEAGSSFISEMVRCGRLIPRMDSEFFQVYGNKLRVFGTETQVMQLGFNIGSNMEAMDETP